MCVEIEVFAPVKMSDDEFDFLDDHVNDSSLATMADEVERLALSPPKAPESHESVKSCLPALAPVYEAISSASLASAVSSEPFDLSAEDLVSASVSSASMASSAVLPPTPRTPPSLEIIALEGSGELAFGPVVRRVIMNEPAQILLSASEISLASGFEAEGCRASDWKTDSEEELEASDSEDGEVPLGSRLVLRSHFDELAASISNVSLSKKLVISFVNSDCEEVSVDVPTVRASASPSSASSLVSSVGVPPVPVAASSRSSSPAPDVAGSSVESVSPASLLSPPSAATSTAEDPDTLVVTVGDECIDATLSASSFSMAPPEVPSTQRPGGHEPVRSGLPASAARPFQRVDEEFERAVSVAAALAIDKATKAMLEEERKRSDEALWRSEEKWKQREAEWEEWRWQEKMRRQDEEEEHMRRYGRPLVRRRSPPRQSHHLQPHRQHQHHQRQPYRQRQQQQSHPRQQWSRPRQQRPPSPRQQQQPQFRQQRPPSPRQMREQQQAHQRRLQQQLAEYAAPDVAVRPRTEAAAEAAQAAAGGAFRVVTDGPMISSLNSGPSVFPARDVRIASQSAVQQPVESVSVAAAADVSSGRTRQGSTAAVTRENTVLFRRETEAAVDSPYWDPPIDPSKRPIQKEEANAIIESLVRYAPQMPSLPLFWERTAGAYNYIIHLDYVRKRYEAWRVSIHSSSCRKWPFFDDSGRILILTFVAAVVEFCHISKSFSVTLISPQTYWRSVFKAAGRQAEMRAFARAMLPAAERRNIKPLSEEVRPSYESWERCVQMRLHATTLVSTIRPTVPAPVERVGLPVVNPSSSASHSPLEPEVPSFQRVDAAPANHLSNADVNIFADRPTVRPEPCQHCGMCRPMEWDGRPRGGWETEERRREIEAQRRCVCNSRNEMELEQKVAAERIRKEKEEFEASGWERAEERDKSMAVQEKILRRKEQDDRTRVRNDEIRHDRYLRRMGQKGSLDWQGSTPAWLTHPPPFRSDAEVEEANQRFTAAKLFREKASRHEAVALANVREDIWEEEIASGVGVERR